MTDTLAIPTLWHIQISHYNEKARWALDHKGVAHRRRAPMPGFLHPLVATALTGRPTLPILAIDGRRIGDSTAIIAALEERFPDPPLYPADPARRRRALELEEFFDEEVAPHVRRFIFRRLSRSPEHAVEALRIIGPPLPRGAVGRGVATATSRVFARYYGGSEEADAIARRKITAGYERVLEEVGESGYLVGDTFTVADLSAAALLMHFVAPPELQYALPRLTPELEDFRGSLPPASVEWVRRIWREHRGTSRAVA